MGVLFVGKDCIELTAAGKEILEATSDSENLSKDFFSEYVCIFPRDECGSAEPIKSSY